MFLLGTPAAAWVFALIVVTGLFIAACLWPLRLDVSGKAQGHANGSWAAAAGVELGFVALTVVAATRVPLRLTIAFFGRPSTWRPTLKMRSRRKRAPQQGSAGRTAESQTWDVLDLAAELLSERRHVRLRYLVFETSYGFRDPLLTGKICGALSMLSAVLPPRVVVRQMPRWDFEERWEASFEGRAVLRPLLMLMGIAKTLLLKKRASRRAGREALAAAG